MTDYDYDLVTIGAGGGAYPAAFQLARTGQRVLMIDPKGVMSGNCLAEGCVPSKTIREAAELYRGMRAMPYFPSEVPPDYRSLITFKDAVQQLRYQQHDQELARFGDRLRLIDGIATVLDPHSVAYETKSEVKTVTAKYLLLASGSDISIPPIRGIEHCVTSRDLFAVSPTVATLPRTLAVIGGGYIGLEVATMWHALGVDVTVFEAADQLLPGMDPDFAKLVADGLAKGIGVELGAEVIEVDDHHRVTYSQQSTSAFFDADMVLLATGRHPVYPPGVQELGLLDERGRLVVGPGGTTKMPSIFAAGDVTGTQMLFHAATRESLAVAHNILAGRVVDRADPQTIPATIFTFPEAARVGMTRAELTTRNIDTVEVAAPFDHEARTQILNEPYGEVRLFGDARSGRLLGAWVVGKEAGQLIGELAMAIRLGATIADIASVADQHPLAHEAISRAARTLV
ncbi:dihydrolipoyl dehydrogenase [Ferrimicrobium sp.]|uniref:dihydrolipoyl dehydrogenase n=1 Tax=Ferrimicrobium sp. TaxID=2926050 RepID=UPI0026061B0F|nr:dihydrolipoyl dehydrogenase [Ferrimicrobium sp.]